MAIEVNRIIKVLWTLPAHPNGFSAMRHNRLTKVIVERLFRICFTGIETTDPCVSCILPTQLRFSPSDTVRNRNLDALNDLGDQGCSI